jgi:hypothetical protein
LADQFVISWCNEGLEGIIPVSDIERDVTFRILKGESVQPSVMASVNHMILRARFNLQRAYEIYSIEAEDGITADDIREMFEACPQTAAETIRRIGYKIHSDRPEGGKKYVIT